jgi:hypothetical protein
VESDPIVAEHDFASGFGMDRVGVIEKRRPKKGSAIGGQPEEKKNREMHARAGVNRGLSEHAAAVGREWSDGAENFVGAPYTRRLVYIPKLGIVAKRFAIGLSPIPRGST